jgi:hypothetical protein
VLTRPQLRGLVYLLIVDGKGQIDRCRMHTNVVQNLILLLIWKSLRSLEEGEVLDGVVDSYLLRAWLNHLDLGATPFPEYV